MPRCPVVTKPRICVYPGLETRGQKGSAPMEMRRMRLDTVMPGQSMVFCAKLSFPATPAGAAGGAGAAARDADPLPVSPRRAGHLRRMRSAAPSLRCGGKDAAQIVDGGRPVSRQRACRSRAVALAGNPNVGKSSIFNALTGPAPAHRQLARKDGRCGAG